MTSTEEPRTSVKSHPRNSHAVTVLFVVIAVVNLAVNIDSGAVPSVIEAITTTYGLNGVMLGLLGALPYFGLIAASPLVSLLLNNIRPKSVLLISLGCNFLASLCFAMANRTWMLFVARFMIGFTQSGFCIYIPVWIDEFAPESCLALWMGLLQGATIGGVMVGYLTAGFLWAGGADWRWSIVIQCVVIGLGFVVICLVPARFVDLYESNSYPNLWSFGDDVPTPSDTSLAPRTLEGNEGQDICTIASRSPSQFSSGRKWSESIVQSTPRKLAVYHRIERQLSGSSLPMTTSTIGVPTGADIYSVEDQNPIKNRHDNKRAPTLVAPTVGGSVMEVIEFHARFDDPLVLRRDRSPRSSTKICEKRSNPESCTMQIFRLFSNPIYTSLALCLCTLLFVVTGVQYWSSIYMLNVLNVDAKTVLISFSATAASAPTVGVIIGGVLVDRIGGYKTEHGMFRTLALASVSAVLASVSGFLAGFVTQFLVCIISIWFLLFFGALMMPPITGILIASVDPNLRASASSFSMCLYNILGYSLGSFLPGLVSQRFGLRIGTQFIFGWSILGVFEVLAATIFAWRRKISPKEVTVDFSSLGGLQPTVSTVSHVDPGCSRNSTCENAGE